MNVERMCYPTKIKKPLESLTWEKTKFFKNMA
jgi:hypothetical protein